MRHYTHGAVPENVKQSYLEQMLDYYKNTEMQHMLMPEEYKERVQLPFLSNTPSPGKTMNQERTGWVDIPGSVPETTISGTRYVTAPMDRPEGMPEHLSYGDVGPDYITMMNIMKAQADSNMNIGFMTDEYMRDNPNTGAYFRSGDQTIALNPYRMLDFNDPKVRAAFGQRPIDMPGQLSYSREGLRDLSMLEGTSLDFSDDWNRNVVSHEIGHYGSLWGRNNPKYENITANKFEFPNWTRNVNMTKFSPSDPGGNYAIEDKDIQDFQGHNMAYWVGRAHDESWNPKTLEFETGLTRDRDMYLTKEGAQNYGAWKHNAQQYIERGGPEPPDTSFFRGADPAKTFTRPASGPRGPGRHHARNTGGLVSLVL